MTFQNGSSVYVSLARAMGYREIMVGELEAIVLHAGPGETDVMLLPSDANLADAAEILPEVELTLAGLREGAVYVLRNMNNEWLRSR